MPRPREEKKAARAALERQHRLAKRRLAEQQNTPPAVVRKPKHSCRDCQIPVSRSAKACPECGAKKPHIGKFQWGFNKFANFLIVVGLLLWLAPNLLAFCASAL